MSVVTSITVYLQDAVILFRALRIKSEGIQYFIEFFGFFFLILKLTLTESPCQIVL